MISTKSSSTWILLNAPRWLLCNITVVFLWGFSYQDSDHRNFRYFYFDSTNFTLLTFFRFSQVLIYANNLAYAKMYKVVVNWKHWQNKQLININTIFINQWYRWSAIPLILSVCENITLWMRKSNTGWMKSTRLQWAATKRRKCSNIHK